MTDTDGGAIALRPLEPGDLDLQRLLGDPAMTVFIDVDDWVADPPTPEG